MSPVSIMRGRPAEDPSQQPFRKNALLLCLNTTQLKQTSTVEMKVFGVRTSVADVFSL